MGFVSIAPRTSFTRRSTAKNSSLTPTCRKETAHFPQCSSSMVAHGGRDLEPNSPCMPKASLGAATAVLQSTTALHPSTKARHKSRTAAMLSGGFANTRPDTRPTPVVSARSAIRPVVTWFRYLPPLACRKRTTQRASAQKSPLQSPGAHQPIFELTEKIPRCSPIGWEARSAISGKSIIRRRPPLLSTRTTHRFSSSTAQQICLCL